MNLHNYQKVAVDFVMNTPSCALWVDMGLGKTIATLIAIENLFNQFEIGKVLVIAPLRVALITWPEEIRKWKQLKNLTFSVIYGTQKARSSKVFENTDIHIINRENVPWLVREYHKKWPYDVVVIDESSSFKSSKTRRFKALKKVIKKIDRVIELTGTPASNGLMDLWSQIYLLDQGQRLGETFFAFRNRWFTSDHMGWEWTLNPGAEEEIHSKIKDLCLRLSAKDYLKMPDKIMNNVYVKLEPTVWKLYKQFERDFLIEIQKKTIIAVNAGVLRNKLRQVCNGALYAEDKSFTEIHDEKLNALESIIEEANGQPLLLAYNFVSDWLRIKKRFKYATHINEEYSIRHWEQGNVKLLCTHPASAAHGLNLQEGGNSIVWFGAEWSLELYEQFNARLYRQGQTKPVFIHHIIVKNSVEEIVVEALKSKKSVQESLLNSINNGT